MFFLAATIMAAGALRACGARWLFLCLAVLLYALSSIMRGG